MVAPDRASAKDYFLTIGGGYSPTGNQVSLEKNVVFFQKVLDEGAFESAPHSVYFADGDNPQRDLQYVDPSKKPPKVNRLLARIFKQERYLGYCYRDHQLRGVSGGSSKANIEKWFNEVGAKLKPSDRLVIYVTAHGGRGDGKEAHNTKLYLWNMQAIKMTDLVVQLDKISPQVPVALVMVQCYAGGFANVIFNGGNPKKGPTAANRCGFYATVQTRPAAGCTADINEANYQEYSSFFWSALRGKSRVDEEIPPPDYNNDGEISFDEAHAYAVLASETIDIPIKTSGALLRSLSKTKVKGRHDLLTADSPYSQLLSLATPSERAILEGLSRQLELQGDNRAKAARDKAALLLKDKKSLEAKKKKAYADAGKLVKPIRVALVNRWPELTNAWNPQVQEFLGSESATIIKTIESHPKYAEFNRRYKAAEAMSYDILKIDKRWAKTQRVLRTLDNVALAANLPKLADEMVVARYHRLLESEQGTLGRFGPLPENPDPLPVNPDPVVAEVKTSDGS
jgi:hypothetical protein